MNLNELGWAPFFQRQLLPEERELVPARVCRQDSNQYHLLSAHGSLTGLLPGRFRRQALSKADLPAVGDWVLTGATDGAESGQVRIARLLERKSKFSRKEAGEAVNEQIIAANIDIVFIVTGLDHDFNPNRIARYLLLSRNSGALPCLILNKADLCRDPGEKLAQLGATVRGLPVYIVSAKEKGAPDGIRERLGVGSTGAFLGSSGVGKSTIINSLLGCDRFDTGAVRRDDSKGRHTTSFREMVQTPGGGLIIDTPGMRELQIWASEADLARSFEDIESLAGRCRFSDCRHRTEPGCAVIRAISGGELAPGRLEQYAKLQKELADFTSRQDAASRAESRRAKKRPARGAGNRPGKRG